jgi:hypothetical protein
MVFKKGNIPWMKGRKTPEETKKKQSEAKKGKKLSEEHKRKLRDNAKTNPNFGMKGKHHSAKTKKKLSDANKGYICLEKTRKKISKANRGRFVSEATRRKLSEKNTGRKHTEKSKRKISKANKGRKHTEKSKKKMSLLHKKEGYVNEGQFKKGTQHWLGRKHTEKSKRKISESHKKENLSEETLRKLSEVKLGEKNYSWLGGISFEPYDKNFNRRFKKFIRDRDSNTCMLCGINRKKLKKALHVHHCDYDKLNTKEENCLSLCGSCHGKTNSNRKHWTKFFQSLLKEKYGY